MPIICLFFEISTMVIERRRHLLHFIGGQHQIFSNSLCEKTLIQTGKLSCFKEFFLVKKEYSLL